MHSVFVPFLLSYATHILCLPIFFSPGGAVGSRQQLTGTTTGGSSGGGAFPFVSPPTSMAAHPQNPAVPPSSTNPYHSAFYSQTQPVSVLQPTPLSNPAPLTSGVGSQAMQGQTQPTYFAPHSAQAVPAPPQQMRNPNGVCVCVCVHVCVFCATLAVLIHNGIVGWESCNG